jgi:hypothetical protein
VSTADVGDRFIARVARNIDGPLGTVIPRGSRASVRVTSLTGRLGEEQISIDVTSISVRGTAHPVDVRVIDTELDRTPGADRCIIQGGDITTRLTRPLRLRAD